MRTAAFFRSLLALPRQMVRLGRMLDQLEAGARSAEALFYLQVLQKVWPEAVEELMPRVQLPAGAVPDISSWYVKARQPGSLRRQVSDSLLSMAEWLGSPPLAAKIALFEEALRLPSEHAPAAFTRYMLFMAQYGDTDEQLLGIGDRFLTCGPGIWGKSFKRKRAWGLYLAALVRTGRRDEALDLLKQFTRHYGLSGLETIPPAALFAREHGYANRAVERAADLMRLVRENEKRGALARFMAGRSVAVVGNSPLERGRGRGDEIDRHDLVVRFNDAPADPAFKADFGLKTTILSKNLARWQAPIHPAAEVVLIPDGLERLPLLPETIKAFLAAARAGRLVCGLPLEEYRLIMRAAGFSHLSTGVAVCAYLKRLLPPLARGDLFGFSHFLDDTAVHYGAYGQFHYYKKRCDEPRDLTWHLHPLAREREFLYALFPTEDCESCRLQ